MSKPANGLLPGSEGVASSDGEGPGTPKSVGLSHLSYYQDLTIEAGEESEEKKVAEFECIPIFPIPIHGLQFLIILLLIPRKYLNVYNLDEKFEKSRIEGKKYSE